MKPIAAIIAGIVFMGLSNMVQAQQPAAKRISINEAIALAKNNLQYEVNNQQINRGKAQVKQQQLYLRPVYLQRTKT